MNLNNTPVTASAPASDRAFLAAEVTPDASGKWNITRFQVESVMVKIPNAGSYRVQNQLGLQGYFGSSLFLELAEMAKAQELIEAQFSPTDGDSIGDESWLTLTEADDLRMILNQLLAKHGSYTVAEIQNGLRLNEHTVVSSDCSDLLLEIQDQLPEHIVKRVNWEEQDLSAFVFNGSAFVKEAN